MNQIEVPAGVLKAWQEMKPKQLRRELRVMYLANARFMLELQELRSVASVIRNFLNVEEREQ